MTMTDPIADMLTRVRNASQAFHDTATMPHSTIKVHIAEILTTQGYIAGYEVNDAAEGQVGKTLSITLKYGTNRERAIAGVRSRPACRRCWVVSASPSSPPLRVC
jgi:small subunit ribosomal protein S8